jgi:hypothetical protein
VRTEAGTPSGQYAVVVSVYDAGGKRMTPLADGTTELTVGRLSIR